MEKEPGKDSLPPLSLPVCVCGDSSLFVPHTHCLMSGSSRVGFCLSDKKRRRINLQAFADFCAGHGVEVVEIDLTQPMGPQGPFDVIVHKLSDVIVEAEHDSQSQQLLVNFQSFVSDNPSTVLLDPLPAMTGCSTALHLCKTRVAQALSPESFVNHGAVLHKVFVVGEKHFCVERTPQEQPPGPVLDEQTPLLPPPSSEAVAALVKELRLQLGMALFGVDVIINTHTHTLTVIDINIFPGYEGVPQFFSALLSHIQSVLGNSRPSLRMKN
ncbi:hypothetical protein F7725_021083 [Dissostichus mawsoni]|uniref:Inositol-tetrakisphosphate 1-kinase n=1 Tax=Dissostichus mawsoni TaxID=36200 RepID=A0A7J5YF42_DISMA|nr:hypothetical protein F7725_021083 [Dissostichus mawsoni]